MTLTRGDVCSTSSCVRSNARNSMSSMERTQTSAEVRFAFWLHSKKNPFRACATMRVCLRVCACACVCVRACVCMCACVCVRARVRTAPLPSPKLFVQLQFCVCIALAFVSAATAERPLQSQDPEFVNEPFSNFDFTCPPSMALSFLDSSFVSYERKRPGECMCPCVFVCVCLCVAQANVS